MPVKKRRTSSRASKKPRPPRPLWVPTAKEIQKTRVAKWMKARGFKKVEDFHRWSVENREEFWRDAIENLGVRFRKSPSRILDGSFPVEAARWLPDARFNIAESCFQADPMATAIVQQREGGPRVKMSYGELDALSNRVALSLKKAGIACAEGVAIDMPMTVEAVAIYLGVVKLGAYVIGIADSFAASEIATRLKIANAKLVITQDVIKREGKSLPLYAKVIEAQAPKTVVLPSDPQSATIEHPLRSGDLTWKDFLVEEDLFETQTCQPEDITNVLFSSGTTGEPKAIPWSQITPIKCGADALCYHDVKPGDVVAWPTSLGWMMGPWLIYAALLNRATLALYVGLPQSRAFGEFVDGAKVTVLGVVPSLIKTWKQTGCMKGLKWKHLRAFSSTGECSNESDQTWLMKLCGKKPVVEYCGGTEIGGGYLTSVLIKPNVPAAFNTLAFGIDAVILDESGTPSTNGELFLIPPSIGLSNRLLNKDHAEVYYADCPKGPQGQTLRRHGDQVESIGGGFYRMHGRVDDTMNLGGIKVSSAEIETVLNQAPQVLETAAIAVPPEGGGPSCLVIYAVLKKKNGIGKEELLPVLQKCIRAGLNPLFKITDLKIVESLPRTASNKVMRRVLKAEYLKRRP
jgi:acetyl-CoA synthetase